MANISADFVGLNTLVYDPIVSGSSPNIEHTASIGWDNDRYDVNTYRNGKFANPARLPEQKLFAALNLHRNGPYGYPTFKQIRNGDKPIVKYYKKNSILPYITTDISTYTVATEPCVSFKNHPLEYSVTTTDGLTPDIKISYSNNLTFFANEKTNQDHDIELSNHTSELYEGQIYNSFKELYLNENVETPISALNSLIYTTTVFPADKNNIGNIRNRPTFVNDFWRSNRNDRTYTGSLGGWNDKEASRWALDAERDFTTYSITGAAPRQVLGHAPSGSGILQNYGTDIGTVLNPMFALYSLKHTSPGTASVVAQSGISIAETGSTANDLIVERHLFGGNAQWDAGTQAGFYTTFTTKRGNKSTTNFIFNDKQKEPFYDSYALYSDIIKFKAKGYSVFSEYKISEDYGNLSSGISVQTSNDFISEDTFTVSGGISGKNKSDEDNFYDVYSFSDLLGEELQNILGDHSGYASPTKIKLKAKGILKFLPYDGFYPAERTAQLAEEFYNSYNGKLKFKGTTGKNIRKKFRAFNAPFYAPGIMFNSIKSGIAVDFPIFTGSFKVTRFQHLYNSTGDVSSHSGSVDDWMITTASDGTPYFGHRVPFEAIVNPDSYVGDIPITDLYQHPSGSQNITASLRNSGDLKYGLMAENFFAEVPNFFLNGFTTLKSAQDDLSTFGNRAASKSSYAMRLKMYRSVSGTDQDNVYPVVGGDATKGYELPQDPTGSIVGGTGNIIPKVSETFTMYSRPSAFGPSIMGTPTGSMYDSRGGYNFAYTPPYYHGQAWADILYEVPSGESGKVSLSDILANSTVKYYRVVAKKSGADATLSDETWPQQHGNNLGLQSNRYINTNAMQISASLNLFGTQDVSALAVGSQTRPASNASKWVISPKFETPMLNFNSVSITTPTFASQSVPRGIWHQYGKPPTDDNTGVFMEITDVPEAWTTGRLGLNSKLTGSLADLCGFSKSPQRLGDARESKEIKEAIVVVPFVESDDGGRSFVSIDRNRINTALGDPTALFPAGDSIQDMVDRMQEYYLPPEFDFISDETLDPFAMYFLEFKHTLSKQDLTDIWQNLPPTIATSFEEKEVTYEHDINTQELLGNLMTITSLGTGPGTSELEGITNSDTMLQALSQLRFMVFKVKQRAASIYHEQTYIRTSDAPATSGTSARFNWPYDFFSLVEFGKVNFGFEIGAMNEVQEEDVLVNSPLPSVGSKAAS